MKFVLINGGLGNQVFQYIFGKTLEIVSGESVIFDDSYFCTPLGLKHANGVSSQRLQLKEVFDIDLPTLSQQVDPDEWHEIISLILHPESGKPGSIPEFLRTKYPNLTMVAETSDFKFDGPVLHTFTNTYEPQILITPPPTYYHGYWINKSWLMTTQDTVLKTLQFKPITEPHNLTYAKQIQESNSVAIHIRRFSVEGYQWDLSPEFYHNAIIRFINQLENPTFFVFSDVLSYCKTAYKELGLDLVGERVVFIEGNEAEGTNYRDMQLMSMCKHMIIANSSFSYLAALLNTHPNKLIANPTPREI